MRGHGAKDIGQQDLLRARLDAQINMRECSPSDRKIINQGKFTHIDLCNIRIICQVQLSSSMKIYPLVNTL